MQYNFALLEMLPKLVDQDKSNVKGDTSSAYSQLEQLLVGTYLFFHQYVTRT